MGVVVGETFAEVQMLALDHGSSLDMVRIP